LDPTGKNRADAGATMAYQPDQVTMVNADELAGVDGIRWWHPSLEYGRFAAHNQRLGDGSVRE